MIRFRLLLALLLAGSVHTAWAQSYARPRLPAGPRPQPTARDTARRTLPRVQQPTRFASFEEYVAQEGEELPPGDGGVVVEGETSSVGPTVASEGYRDEGAFYGDAHGGEVCAACGGRCPCDCRRPNYLPPLHGGWFNLDYILWWGKGTDLPPLVTTSPVSADPLTYGVLGAPGTSVLFGNENVDQGARSGGRIDAGMWFDEFQDFGLGVNFLGIQRAATVFDASSDGDPIIARPFFNVEDGANDAQVIAQPGITSGGVHIQTANTVLGGEVFAREMVWVEPGYRLDLLYGYRVLRIDESVAIYDSTVITDPQSLLPLGTELFAEDIFNTRNTFQGGQLGLISRAQGACWGYDLIFKLGIGNIYQTATVRGLGQLNVPELGTTTFNGGLYALGTNIGGYSRNVFGFVPEFGVNVHYQFYPGWRIKFGYTFLYMNNVLQAARIIDQNVNPTQITGDLVGPAQPAFTFESDSYWLQGINVGLEFSY